MSTITPHKLGLHHIFKHIPLNAIFDAPSKRRLAKAVNIADLRLCAKARAHKVSFSFYQACVWQLVRNVKINPHPNRNSFYGSFHFIVHFIMFLFTSCVCNYVNT